MMKMTEQSNKKRPNFLLFMPETIRADFIFGQPGLKAITPNLDKMMQESVSFTSFFTQSPFCTPTRCSMFTGRYPHVNGHRSLMYLLQDHERNMFMDLKEAGYQTVCYGKNDLVAGDAIGRSFSETALRVKPKASEWRPPVYPEGHKHFNSFYYGERDKSAAFDSDWACVASALDFLDQEHEDPFCIFLPLGFAHPPYVVEEPYFSLHDRKQVKPPISSAYSNKSKTNEIYYKARALEQLTEDDFIEIRATYQGMISRVDHLFGTLLDKLDERGLADDTVVIFFSDHGDYAGDYGMVEKINYNFDDCLLNIPLVMRVPGVAGGWQRECFVEGIDIYPTIMEMAGLTAAHQHFGHSIVDLLDQEADDCHRDYVFAEAGFDKEEPQSYTPLSHVKGSLYEITGKRLFAYRGVPGRRVMIRDNEWKYVFSPQGYEELFDLQNDPDETTNLINQGHEKEKRLMRDRLLEWFVQTSDAVPFEHDKRGFS